MLKDLLQLIARGGVRRYEDLTQELAITQPLLEAMLEDLARLGYLRAVGATCDTKCKSCPMGGCSIAGPGKLWTLTEKGVSAARKANRQD